MHMKNTILRMATGASILFLLMGLAYPALRGQRILDVPWLILSAIGSVLVAVIADPLTQRRKRRTASKNKHSDD
jgi:hypothetical protein